jgi:hypothetical protein
MRPVTVSLQLFSGLTSNTAVALDDNDKDYIGQLYDWKDCYGRLWCQFHAD